MPTLACYLLIASCCLVPVLEGRMVQLSLDAASSVTGLYVDGKSQSLDSRKANDWRRVQKINVPGDSCTLAISAYCEDNVNASRCFAGLVFSDKQCRWFSSSGNCKCTTSVDRIKSKWFRSTFDDSNWLPASNLYSVAGSDSPYNILQDNFCADASWIWVASIRESNVYCRCSLQVDGGWTPWSTCQGNTQTRTCTNPAPTCGGLACVGSATRTPCDSSSCVDNCLTCDNGGNCVACANGYYLKGGKCVVCSKECATCTGISTCQSCTAGYFFKNSKCKACATGCAACSGTRANCSECKDGYVRKGKSCNLTTTKNNND
jgi:hypothetical protein